MQGPFWQYYGGKWRSAPHYPQPDYPTIIEPFAGAAGYSMRHYKKNVLLFDKSEQICGVWDYLIRSWPDEILRLPDIKIGQTVDDLHICQEARWLIGLWCNPGSASPRKSPSVWGARETQQKKNWNTLGRNRCAKQSPLIKHWTIKLGTYRDAQDAPATWFVDPPYQGAAGKHYPHGSGKIDYADLAAWCKDRDGQVIVCEGPRADWLPFEPFLVARGCSGKNRSGRSVEHIWLNHPVWRQQSLL